MKGPRQTIFFAESDYLVHWRKRGDETQFVQDERWYAPEGRWDCIWTMPRPGLYIEHQSGHGMGVLFDAQGRAELALMAEDGSGCTVQARVDRQAKFGSPARWRLVLEGFLVELYLDDYLIQCFSLPAPASGRIGLLDGGVPGACGDVRIWQ